MKWNKITTRQLTDEEREYYGPNIEYIWDGVCPDIDEEVLVFNKGNIYIDTFTDFDEGVGFCDTDEETVYWMSLPEFSKEEEV